MRKIVITWAVAVMLLLAACQPLPLEEAPSMTEEAYPPASEQVLSPTQESDEAKFTEAYPEPLTRKLDLPEGAIIVYRRSGGFAGLNEEWAIYSDGRITAEDGKEWHITPGQVEALVVQIDELGFFELGGSYIPLDTCCDRFTYEVTVRSGDKENRVTTIDAAPDVPPELWRVIEKINDLVLSLERD